MIAIMLSACGGGNSSNTSSSVDVPSAVVTAREVTINLPEKISVNEKSSLTVNLSLSGTILPSDKIILSSSAPILTSQINDEKNVLIVDVADVLADTNVTIKLVIEGPSNKPTREMNVLILNVSANNLVQEMTNRIEELKNEYEHSEELHIADMLSLVSPLKRTNTEAFNHITEDFQKSLDITKNFLIVISERYSSAIKQYQSKSINEEQLYAIYSNNRVTKTDYNLEKLKAINKLLAELQIPIEFPANIDNIKSNFTGNTKIGSYVGDKFIFIKKYFYLNSILDKSCIGS